MTPNQRKVLNRVNLRTKMIRRRRIEFVACLIGCGWSAKEIAHRFGLSDKHVQSMQTAALARFGSAAAITRFAVRCGFLFVLALLPACVTPTYSPIPVGPPPTNTPPSALLVSPELKPQAKAKPFKPTYTSGTLVWTNSPDVIGVVLTYGVFGGSQSALLLSPWVTSYQFTGLRVGTTYSFQVCETNSAGAGCSAITWPASVWTAVQ